MRFLTPAWFLLISLALPILLLYMLRLRRRTVQVSSTMLWQTLLRDRQANTPWQRLRRNLLLFLQLLILAALVFALARPGWQVPTIASGSMIVMLDASASMSATDIEPNRFEAARAAISSLIDNLQDSSKMTLILVSRQPEILAAGESNLENLRKSLAKANLTWEEANWQTAFTLAASAINTGEEKTTTVVIVSDGGIPSEDIPPLPVEIQYLPVGKLGNNLAITALAVRPAGENNELFVNVKNFGLEKRTGILSIYLNENLLNAQQVTLASGEQAGLSLADFPTENGIVMARLSPLSENPENAAWDSLEADNVAFTINQNTARRRILLVSPGNFFLEQILSSIPDIEAFRALPEQNRFLNPEESFDLYILDEILPVSRETGLSQLPEGNLLWINPPTNPLFTVTETFSPVQDVRVNEHALTQNVDWSAVKIQKARRIQTPAWAEILVDTPAGPLLIAGETEGKRIVALAFDLNDSNLPLQVAFPILFANLMEYLAPPSGVKQDMPILPSESITINIPSAVKEVVIASPNGNLFSLLPSETGYFFSQTSELGVYAINYLTNEQQRAEFFAVNLFSTLESSIQPSEAIRVGRATIPAGEQGDLGLHEFWPWLVVIGLLLTLAEWWFYHRRLVLPKPIGVSKLNIFHRMREP